MPRSCAVPIAATAEGRLSLKKKSARLTTLPSG
jgi:hypothetical protein